jgi:hypothetical protein
LITVGEAFNWFDPQPTRTEFQRILKPTGWLAKLRNYGTDLEVGGALEKIYPKETDTGGSMPGRGIPVGFYFGNNNYETKVYEFSSEENWENFFGAISSASFAPDEDHPSFAGFAQAAKVVFDQFSRDGVISFHGRTELCLGHMSEGDVAG